MTAKYRVCPKCKTSWTPSSIKTCPTCVSPKAAEAPGGPDRMNALAEWLRGWLIVSEDGKRLDANTALSLAIDQLQDPEENGEIVALLVAPAAEAPGGPEEQLGVCDQGFAGRLPHPKDCHLTGPCVNWTTWVAPAAPSERARKK